MYNFNKVTLYAAVLMLSASFALVVAVSLFPNHNTTVYTSWSSKQCVIVYSDKGYDCDSLPEKYHNVWVK